jgi:hypothetical protein
MSTFMHAWKSVVTSFLLVVGIVALSAAPQQNASKSAPLAIQEQGSFAVGGTVVTAPGTFDPIAQGAYNPAGADPRGQTLHGDHAYVFYQVPVNARRLPLVFWHGHGQSAKTWETTPGGREGFQTIFLRRQYSVYLLDQPRRGQAARGTQRVPFPPRPTISCGSGSFVWASGRTSIRACSSHAIPARSTSSSGKWCQIQGRTTWR